MKADEKEKSSHDSEIKEKIAHLENILSRHLPEIVKNIENTSENNSKFVNLIQENVRVQNDNMNYLEKKLEFIDKTIELKTKHFDEVIKASTDNNDTLARMVQSNLSAQDNTLDKLNSDINSFKYLFVVAIISIGAIIWGIGSHFHKRQLQRIAQTSAGSFDPAPILSSLEETRRLITKLHEDNQNILAAIQSEGRQNIANIEKSSPRKLDASADNQKIINALQKEHKELLNALARSNEELIHSLTQSMRSEKTKTVTAPPSKKSAVRERERPKPSPDSDELEEELEEEEE